MRYYIKPVLLALILSATVVAALHRGRRAAISQQQEQLDTSRFPIVDYSSAPPIDPNERAKTEARGKKYNGRSRGRITESAEKVFMITDWELGLPALPVARSAAVIVGEVTSAAAHLSDDRTAVYSEFSVRIEDVLKPDHLTALTVGNSIVVERDGGRVRFPSGKVAIFVTVYQDMPRVGSRYVLFLTHRFPMGGDYEQDFYALTGYELRSGRVFPLDNINSTHPIAAYKGVDEVAFLNDLRDAIANCRFN